MEIYDVIIIGAGASGLMAAREVSKAGKRVLLFEARDRIGGRIFPLPKEKLGYVAEGGAEFVHGDALVTKALIEEAGLISSSVEGDYWDVRVTPALKNNGVILDHQEELREKLESLTQDMSVAEFLRTYFCEPRYENLRSSITRMVEGYDLGDMERASTYAIRDEWANDGDIHNGRLSGGYKALLSFLESECNAHGVAFRLNTIVESVSIVSESVAVKVKDGAIYKGQKCIVTVPLPLLKTISFSPEIPEKIAAVEKMGYGTVIKLLIRFSDTWWKKLSSHDFSKLQMILSDEPIGTWWTQYPHDVPVLTGWRGGKYAERFRNSSDVEVLDTAMSSLAKTFDVSKETILNKIISWQIVNWTADEFAQGAYSYYTTKSQQASKIVAAPVQNKIFFAGEALYTGNDIATVEGALASGKETARILLTHS